jgi:hypothetical protein
MSIFSRLPRPLVVGLVTVLLTLLIGTSTLLVFGVRGSSHAFASVFAAPPTCAIIHDAAHCTGKNPVTQQCVARENAVNVAAQATISTIGIVQRRFSQICTSWWGRIFDYRPGIHTETITIGTQTYTGKPQFVGPTYSIFYTPMVFDPPVSAAPQIVGSMQIGTHSTLTATLPTISPPKQ